MPLSTAFPHLFAGLSVGGPCHYKGLVPCTVCGFGIWHGDVGPAHAYIQLCPIADKDLVPLHAWRATRLSDHSGIALHHVDWWPVRDLTGIWPGSQVSRPRCPFQANYSLQFFFFFTYPGPWDLDTWEIPHGHTFRRGSLNQYTTLRFFKYLNRHYTLYCSILIFYRYMILIN